MKSMNHGSFANKPSQSITFSSQKRTTTVSNKISRSPSSSSPIPTLFSSLSSSTTASFSLVTSPTATTASTTPTTAENNSSTTTMASGTIVGIVFSIVCGISLLTFFIFFTIIRKKRKRLSIKKSTDINELAFYSNNSNQEKNNTNTLPPLGEYTIISSFTQTLDDELYIQPGDKIQVLNEYNDGWCLAKNLTRGGSTGVLPQNCFLSPS